MIACDRFDELLQDRLADGLPPADEADFEAHLAACADCVRVMKAYVHATALASAAYPEADEPTTPLPESIVRSVLAHVRRGATSTGSASGVA